MAKLNINIKNIANKAVTFSELMTNREKIETRDIIKYHPDKITIVAAEPVEVPDEKSEDGVSRFYVYHIKEEPNKFAFAGYVLNKILDDIFTACEGVKEDFDDTLASGDLTVKLSEGKTKDNKNSITLVTVV